MLLLKLYKKPLEWFKRAKEDVSKVSQVGRVWVNRSFLIQERKRLFQKVGEIVCQQSHLKKNPHEDTSLKRLLDQIERLDKKINGLETEFHEFSKAISLRLDADMGADPPKKSKGKKK